MAFDFSCCLQSKLCCYLTAFIAALFFFKYSGLNRIFKPFQLSIAAKIMSVMLPEYHRQMQKYKQEIFESIEPGSILEFGVGYGANLDYYPKGSKLTVFEPNYKNKPYLLENLKGRENVTLEKFIVGRGEDMSEIPSNSMSAVVCSLVLCTVEDVKQVLKEVIRVLKPGGKFYYLEHVAAEKGTGLYYFQILIDPFWYNVFDGCRTTRPTWKYIENAGFSEVKQRRFYSHVKTRVPIWSVIRPHMLGVAVK